MRYGQVWFPGDGIMTNTSVDGEERVAAGEKQGDRSTHPRWGAAVAAMLAFCLLLVVWWQAGRWYEAQLRAQSRIEERAEAAIEVTLQGNVLSSILNRRFARLQGLVAFAQTVPADQTFGEQFEHLSLIHI